MSNFNKCMGVNMKKGRLKKIVAASLVLAAASALQTAPAYAGVVVKGAGQENIEGQIIQAKQAGYVEAYIISGMNLVVSKAQMKSMGGDPNREEYKFTETNPNTKYFKAGTDLSKLTYSRYTHSDGTPYTGLYRETDSNGKPKSWIVLDKDGFWLKDMSSRQTAWDNGRMSADFIVQSGANYNEADGKNYLGLETTKDDASIAYAIVNNWQKWGRVWYKSNDKGICYQNQWNKDTDGKWYYFDNNCQMVTNQSVDGYWIGADGAWQN